MEVALHSGSELVKTNSCPLAPRPLGGDRAPPSPGLRECAGKSLGRRRAGPCAMRRSGGPFVPFSFFRETKRGGNARESACAALRAPCTHVCGQAAPATRATPGMCTLCDMCGRKPVCAHVCARARAHGRARPPVRTNCLHISHSFDFVRVLPAQVPALCGQVPAQRVRLAGFMHRRARPGRSRDKLKHRRGTSRCARPATRPRSQGGEPAEHSNTEPRMGQKRELL